MPGLKGSLDQRLFAAYYPQQDGKNYRPVSHGVECTRFEPMANQPRWSYTIDSSVEAGRTYAVPYIPQFMQLKNIPHKVLRGYLGEDLVRIVTMEVLRRLADNDGITDFRFIKKKRNTELVRRGNFVAEFITRYAVEITRISHRKHRTSPLTEYDGMLEYAFEDGRKGLVVCESKTGPLDPDPLYEEYIAGAGQRKHKTKINEKIIEPLKALFPNHHIDYLLMATEDQIVHGGFLADNLVALMRHLNRYNIGFIPFSFNLTNDQMNGALDDMNKKLPAFQDLQRRQLEGQRLDAEHDILLAGGRLWIINRGRVEMILRELPGGAWRTEFMDADYRAKSAHHNHHALPLT